MTYLFCDAQDFAKERLNDYYKEEDIHPESYIAGIEDAIIWLISKPLSSRMTILEKDNLKEIFANIHLSGSNGDVGNIIMENKLKKIFGEEMFEKKLNRK